MHRSPQMHTPRNAITHSHRPARKSARKLARKSTCLRRGNQSGRRVGASGPPALFPISPVARTPPPGAVATRNSRATRAEIAGADFVTRGARGKTAGQLTSSATNDSGSSQNSITIRSRADGPGGRPGRRQTGSAQSLRPPDWLAGKWSCADSKDAYYIPPLSSRRLVADCRRLSAPLIFVCILVLFPLQNRIFCLMKIIQAK